MADDTKYWVFECQQTGEYWFRTNTYSDGTTEVTVDFWEIMLQKGAIPSGWALPPRGTSSLIRQTATEIEAKVNDTGVNITDGKIILKADNTIFQSLDGTQSAAVQVKADGTLYTKNMEAETGTFTGKITGSLRNPLWRIDNNPTGYIKDNIALCTVRNGATYFPSSWEIYLGDNPTESSGRLIRLIGGKWNTDISYGVTTVTVKDSNDNTYPIYQDGIARDSIIVSNEVVELLGFGDKDNFWGFVEINRKNFMTQFAYGKQVCTLAWGRMIYQTNGGYFMPYINYRKFDDTTIVFDRLGTGEYLITLDHPRNKPWFKDVREIIVEVAGFGSISGGTTPCKASIRKLVYRKITYTSSGCTIYSETLNADGFATETTTRATTGDYVAYRTEVYVDTSDDATRNDGGFTFVMHNMNDFFIPS